MSIKKNRAEMGMKFSEYTDPWSIPEYMNDKISEREAELLKQKNLFVNATPEIIDIIKRSNAISTSKGKSHFLLRSPIKRKSKRQIEQEKMKAEADENYVNELQDKLEEMRSTIEQFDQINEEAFENKEKLAKLYQLSIIDSDGDVKENEN